MPCTPVAHRMHTSRTPLHQQPVHSGVDWPDLLGRRVGVGPMLCRTRGLVADSPDLLGRRRPMLCRTRCRTRGLVADSPDLLGRRRPMLCRTRGLVADSPDLLGGHACQGDWCCVRHRGGQSGSTGWAPVIEVSDKGSPTDGTSAQVSATVADVLVSGRCGVRQLSDIGHL
jgi:hypothetical protein